MLLWSDHNLFHKRRKPIKPANGPGHLIAMVCDSVQRLLDGAVQCLDRGDSTGADADLRKAQRILLELIGALDRAVSPDLTETLSAFYQRVFDDIAYARLHDDSEAVARVARHFRGWRETWSQARVNSSDDSSLFCPVAATGV